MKFSEYVKQLKEYEPENFIVITYNKKVFVYKGESEYDELTVSSDGFVKIKEYLDYEAVGVEVFLEENTNGSNLFALEILKMKYEKQKQNLEKLNKWWDKHQKENNIYMIGVIISTFIIFGFWLLMTKIG